MRIDACPDFKRFHFFARLLRNSIWQDDGAKEGMRELGPPQVTLPLYYSGLRPGMRVRVSDATPAGLSAAPRRPDQLHVARRWTLFLRATLQTRDHGSGGHTNGMDGVRSVQRAVHY